MHPLFQLFHSPSGLVVFINPNSYDCHQEMWRVLAVWLGLQFPLPLWSPIVGCSRFSAFENFLERVGNSWWIVYILSEIPDKKKPWSQKQHQQNPPRTPFVMHVLVLSLVSLPDDPRKKPVIKKKFMTEIDQVQDTLVLSDKRYRRNLKQPQPCTRWDLSVAKA